MKNRLIKHWFSLCILTIIIKLLLATLGSNYDIESYRIVGDLIKDGKNFYVHTHRYNYGPVWANFLGLLRWIQVNVLSDQSLIVLHILVTLLLSIIDVCIANILKSSYSIVSGLVFLLNPVSFLITGFHGQFDNIAIYLGLLSIIYFLANKQRKSLAFLSASLIVKHVVILFLPWISFNRSVKSHKIKLLYLLLPSILFAASFVPYLVNSKAFTAIKNQVVFYEFGADAALISKGIKALLKFLDVHLPDLFVTPEKLIFLSLIIVFGFVFRKVKLKLLLPLYLITLVGFSSQMSDQYLAIPMLGVAIFWKYWVLRIYMLYATAYLLFDSVNNIGGMIKGIIPELQNNSWLATGLNLAAAQLLLVVFVVIFSLIELRNNKELCRT